MLSTFSGSWNPIAQPSDIQGDSQVLGHETAFDTNNQAEPVERHGGSMHCRGSSNEQDVERELSRIGSVDGNKSVKGVNVNLRGIML